MTADDVARVARGDARNDDLASYLWSRVEIGGKDDCWPWTGPRIAKDGRGILSFRGFRALAPRVAYMVATGKEVPADMLVCHSCDNPSCCNPGHLWLGTHADNVRDMWSKGRQYRNQIEGWQRQLTHCKRGHAFDADNTFWTTRGHRECKLCRALQSARRIRKPRSPQPPEGAR